MKIVPMKCHLGTTKDLDKPGWIFEPKVDGFRAICYVDKNIQLISRAGNDLTRRFPELDFRSAIGANSCMLDGEIIGYNSQGIPSFTALQEGAEAHYIVFDILSVNGKSLINRSLTERKKILDTVIKSKGNLEKIFFTTQGHALWQLMQEKKMEGVIAKDPESHYHPGVRSRQWIKIKLTNTIDCVIVGYTKEKRRISSLALALYNNEKKLQYIGKVGTGFNTTNIKKLGDLLELLQSDSTTVNISPISLPSDIIWVKPKLVCEVKYLEFTHFTILRSSVFLRLREDKKLKECTFQEQV